jgi:hypothetical protein
MTKLIGILTLMLMLLGCSRQVLQAEQKTAEDWFIQARGYEMSGKDSLALKAYEEAFKVDSSAFLKNVIVIRYLRVNQFEKAFKIAKDVQIGLNEYKDGNKVAEFYCYTTDTARAFELWKKLIYNAIEAHQLDSALILANSFVKNMPQYPVPRTMLSYLNEKLKKHQ